MTPLKRPRLDLDRESDPRRRDRDAVDITTAAVRERVTQPPPLRLQCCQRVAHLVLRFRPDTTAGGQAHPPAGVGEQPTATSSSAAATAHVPVPAAMTASTHPTSAPAPHVAARRRRRYCWRRGKLETGTIGGSHSARTALGGAARSRPSIPSEIDVHNAPGACPRSARAHRHWAQRGPPSLNPAPTRQTQRWTKQPNSSRVDAVFRTPGANAGEDNPSLGCSRATRGGTRGGLPMRGPAVERTC